MDHIPWVEKYRPTKFEDIVLDPFNKKILENIIKHNYFPNLLFYGPPGTGKTTTIINLINYYQKKNNQHGKEFKIHLNASDDRGIDIIRNQINTFVQTNPLFGKGMKFVILDEVDYMTKNAQQALRYLIQKYSHNVRFCLICNYISRIDGTLQNEFIRLRFCNLPNADILHFLKKIVKHENINITDNQLLFIQKNLKSDIRSMINFIQSNQNNTDLFDNIITLSFWETIIEKLKSEDDDILLTDFIYKKCLLFNIDIKNCIKEFICYLIRNKEYALQSEWLNVFESIIHNIDFSSHYLLHFAILCLRELYIKL